MSQKLSVRKDRQPALVQQQGVRLGEVARAGASAAKESRRMRNESLRLKERHHQRSIREENRRSQKMSEKESVAMVLRELHLGENRLEGLQYPLDQPVELEHAPRRKSEKVMEVGSPVAAQAAAGFAQFVEKRISNPTPGSPLALARAPHGGNHKILSIPAGPYQVQYGSASDAQSASEQPLDSARVPGLESWPGVTTDGGGAVSD